MHKLNSRLKLTAVVTAALVAGCAGDSNDGAAAPNIGQSVTALVDFINRMIANTSESSDPIDINSLTLAVDDTAEPTPL